MVHAADGPKVKRCLIDGSPAAGKIAKLCLNEGHPVVCVAANVTHAKYLTDTLFSYAAEQMKKGHKYFRTAAYDEFITAACPDHLLEHHDKAHAAASVPAMFQKQPTTQETGKEDVVKIGQVDVKATEETAVVDLATDTASSTDPASVLAAALSAWSE